LQGLFQVAFSHRDLKYRRQPIIDIAAFYPKPEHSIRRFDCRARRGKPTRIGQKRPVFF